MGYQRIPKNSTEAIPKVISDGVPKGIAEKIQNSFRINSHKQMPEGFLNELPNDFTEKLLEIAIGFTYFIAPKFSEDFPTELPKKPQNKLQKKCLKHLPYRCHAVLLENFSERIVK